MIARKIKEAFLYYLVPHESNNFKARSLHASFFVYYIVFLFLLQTGIGIVKNLSGDILGYATDITVDRVIDLVNQERSKLNLNPLTISSELNQAATQKASDMFSNNYWAHVSPTGVTPWVFIRGSGYDYLFAGENLAKNFDKSEEVVSAWMRSPTHKANLLKPEYTEIGLAVMNGALLGEPTTLVVQEFGTRNAFTVPKSSPQKQISVQEPVNPPIYNEGSVRAMPSKQTVSEAKSKAFMPFPLTRSATQYMAFFLMGVLLIDTLFMWKKPVVRSSGHSLAHIIFLASLLGAMGVTGIGVIL